MKRARDKLISIRVSSNLLNKVNDIIEKENIRLTWYDNKIIQSNEYYYRKPNNADLFEIFLEEFIKKYEKTSM